MKTEYQQIIEKINNAVQIERTNEARTEKLINDSRNSYEAAKNRMETALSAGNLSEYQAAGLEAEKVRLELEFYERSKTANRKPAATQDDDTRIIEGLKAEEHHTRTDVFDRLKALFNEALTVCTDGQKRLDEIDSLAKSWNQVVMKSNSNAVNTDTTRLAVAQFAQVINGQLSRFDYMKI